MNKIISTEKIPIKLWLDDMEVGALKQAKNLANLPFAFKWISIMPDSHQGYGMPIGGVMATEDVIVPNAVGVDIGCGMCAVKTSLKNINTEILKKIMREIRKVIPVGFSHHKEMQSESLMPKYDDFVGETLFRSDYPIIDEQFESALKQLGTLGGGNHFIEIQKGSDGFIWIMIHSGSRNLGYKVAKYYNELAYDLNKEWFSDTFLPANKEDSLAFLPVESKEGQNYLREMQYCVDFALANRELMIKRIMDIFISIFPNDKVLDRIYFDKYDSDMINIAHNYVKLENHFGKNVWIHRKGATLARRDTIGIIPGSQGTKSYIVKGKGSLDSFNSCSHGAGRKMSRSAAKRNLNLADEIKKMDDQGIIHGIRNQGDLDEASGSYKDIDVVMKNQEDLVEILVELQPLAVIKS